MLTDEHPANQRGKTEAPLATTSSYTRMLMYDGSHVISNSAGILANHRPAGAEWTKM